MEDAAWKMLLGDHCRIGSLESPVGVSLQGRFDHCRIGSLESQMEEDMKKLRDHCRIGSLEM